MDVIDAIKLRKSVRKYSDRTVEDEKLRAVLEAAALAPSASNRQEWRFIVVRDSATKAALARASKGQKFIGNAPVVLVACAETDHHLMMCGQKCYPIDVAIALDHLSLAAVELGLGTCWIGAFDQGRVRRLLGIPENIPVVELMTLGYPEDPAPKCKSRLGLNEITRYERW